MQGESIFKRTSYSIYSAPIRLFLDYLSSDDFAKYVMRYFNADLKGSSLRIEKSSIVHFFSADQGRRNCDSTYW